MAGLEKDAQAIDEERIAQCEDQLLRGTEMKALAGCGAEAMPCLERAYSVATIAPRLPTPLPEIAAYRLAHVIMRSARTSADLHRANSLFGEAAQLPIDALGPLPRIYRLAVLYRLQQEAESQEERRRFQAERARFFEETCIAVQYHRPHDIRGRDNVAIEGSTLNYLELLAYCTGDDYFGIPRTMSPVGDVVFDDEWCVVGTHGVGQRRIRYNRALAEIEFNARARAGAVDLMFRADRVHAAEASEIWGRTSEPVPVSGAVVRYLALLCSERQCTPREQYRFVFGASDRPTRELKTVNQELKRVLRSVPGVEDAEAVLTGKRGSAPRLNPELRVIGIVHRKVIDERE